jgi:hypothetical protein
MAKGQKRSGREPKKPKQNKNKKSAAAKSSVLSSAPQSKPSAG